MSCVVRLPVPSTSAPALPKFDLLERKQCAWGGATTPCNSGEVKRKGKLFCGKSAAAHGDSPHGWAYNWSMKDTVFLEVPWSGVKEKPWSAQIASLRPAALQWVVFSVLGRTVPCRPDTGQEELKVGHSPHQEVYQIIPPVFLAAQCVILC